MKADLHLHSYYSDGKLSPEELINLAEEKGLDALSLTDHDDVRGASEIEALTRGKGLEFISGVELSSKLGNKEIHVLGYRIEYKNGPLLERLTEFKKMRKSRISKIVEKLNNIGLRIEERDVTKFSKKGLYGRIHVARALIDKGFTRNIEESFRKYLGFGKPGFVPKNDFTVCEAVDLIEANGGIPVIAHPASSKLKESDIKELKSLGIMGIEVYHSKHSSEKEKSLLNLSNKLHMLVTGGSDFHGWEPGDYDNVGHKYVKIGELELLKKT